MLGLRRSRQRRRPAGGRQHQGRQRARHRLPSPTIVAVWCEGFALVVSVAANVVAVWADGVIAIVAAGVVPVVLIGGAYLFLAHRLPVAWQVPRRARAEVAPSRWTHHRPARDAIPGAPGWKAWYANLVAAAVILVPVASASYWHQRELLLATAAPTWIATLLPLAIDGLALRAALTLWLPTPAASTGDTDSRADSDRQDDEQDDEQDAPRLPEIKGVAPEVVAEAAALLAAEPLAGRPRLRLHLVGGGFEVSDYAAGKLLTALRPGRGESA